MQGETWSIIPIKINLFSKYKNSDCTFLKRQSISNAKTKHLLLFRNTMGVYFENQLEYTNTLRGWIQSYWTLNVNGH
jgi:hypothetical protein